MRSFRFGKRRLSGELEDQHRWRLGRALAEHVTGVCRQAGVSVLVVTSDPEVTGWADDIGLETLDEPGTGLDGAAEAGVGVAASRGSPWVVLHADLPLFTPDDLGCLLLPILAGRDVIAPSADGGTTAISSTRSLDFRYGPGSFHRHLRMLDDPVVVVRTGLLHDLDSPADLDSAKHHPAGEWI